MPDGTHEKPDPAAGAKTGWVIAVATEKITLDAKWQGEASFTVTNPGPAPDRAVFDPVGGEGTSDAWFLVDEPLRQVPPGEAVTYRLRMDIPTGTPPGSYAVQGRVYSADGPPEENSVLTKPVGFDVVETALPVRPPRRWLIPVGAAMVLVVAVVAFLLLRDGEDTASGSTTTSSSTSTSSSTTSTSTTSTSSSTTSTSTTTTSSTVPPAIPPEDPRISISPGLVEAGQAVRIVDETPGPHTTQWSFPGGTPATSTSTNPTVAWSTAGAKTITLTVTRDGLSKTTETTLFVEPDCGPNPC